jgi:hypothetical protein
LVEKQLAEFRKDAEGAKVSLFKEYQGFKME